MDKFTKKLSHDATLMNECLIDYNKQVYVKNVNSYSTKGRIRASF